MKASFPVISSALLVLLAGALFSTGARSDERPNLILIMVNILLEPRLMTGERKLVMHLMLLLGNDMILRFGPKESRKIQCLNLQIGVALKNLNKQ